MNVLDFLWTFFPMVFPEAQLPAGELLENEPTLKRKSPQGIQA